MTSKNALKIFRRFFCILLIGGILGVSLVLCINGYILRSTADQLLTPDEAAQLQDVDCILVLGCYVHENGQPSAMLADRLQTAVSLYQNSDIPKLLMSGDHGQKHYDEVNAMKQYALDADIPSSDVFMDHAGFSTYESIYRARDIFLTKKIVIVTQKYHLHRALHIANALGLEAYGVSADSHSYSGQFYREVREVLARSKDFVISVFQPEPTYLGDVIPAYGDGDLTNDKFTDLQ